MGGDLTTAVAIHFILIFSDHAGPAEFETVWVLQAGAIDPELDRIGWRYGRRN
jgi:hypothetical protein